MAPAYYYQTSASFSLPLPLPNLAFFRLLQDFLIRPTAFVSHQSTLPVTALKQKPDPSAYTFKPQGKVQFASVLNGPYREYMALQLITNKAN